jgi:uncharacterized membrane protein
MIMENCSYCFPWIFPILMPIIFPLLLFFFTGRGPFGQRGLMSNRSGSKDTTGAEHVKSPALEKLELRLANGELSLEEFEKLKKAIQGA